MISAKVYSEMTKRFKKLGIFNQSWCNANKCHECLPIRLSPPFLSEILGEQKFNFQKPILLSAEPDQRNRQGYAVPARKHRVAALLRILQLDWGRRNLVAKDATDPDAAIIECSRDMESRCPYSQNSNQLFPFRMNLVVTLKASLG